ncbi:SIR2 family protein [Metabacillus endolithicus]|uniref:NAD(+) hydrolase ThsA n=1 Tax=Metabacillus endolithicus TaxID=1535204 RepID=A0ABW5C327_9BACI|nr:SIR2 family protein [Metabacillus endolithicus]UPG61672.1 SIR2 family protein [Metabacillus endolithicus]
MFNAKIREFIRTYVKAISESNVAVFAGAGLSQPAGYVNWKELMREIAEDIELNIDLESDLIALAQYHVNEFDGRGKINQILIEEFTKNAQITDNHKILSRLPIKTFWTTNYDKLIETSLESNSKKVDAKIVPENLGHTAQNTDAIVYKMHGDITLAHEAVLTKDDYEGYDLKRKLFSTALQGDLVSKTFLFIGFSFDDPNLSYILSRIRILLGENSRNHYCFMKKVSRNDYNTDDDFRYAVIKQELKIKDLKRYRINVLLVDEYQEITYILQHIENIVRRKNIFISGSAIEYGQWSEASAFEFTSNLSREIIKNRNNIVSGFGLGIGSCIISGALEELYESNDNKIEERLKLRPFPQNTVGKTPLEELWTKYRTEMIENVGISIFVFGNKKNKETGEITLATGMIEEFSLAIDKGIIPIPVGATGFTAEHLWKTIMDDFERYVGITSLEPLYSDLNSNKTPSELIEVVLSIINELTKH